MKPALLLLAAAPAFACPLPPPALQGDGVQLAWRADPAIGREAFAMAVRVCPADARLLRVDATMPEHRHGMNYRPRLVPQADGWRVEGLLFHMAGRWELRFDVEQGGRVQSLRQNVELK